MREDVDEDRRRSSWNVGMGVSSVAVYGILVTQSELNLKTDIGAA